jgi:hypothetical protein
MESKRARMFQNAQEEKRRKSGRTESKRARMLPESTGREK